MRDPGIFSPKTLAFYKYGIYFRVDFWNTHFPLLLPSRLNAEQLRHSPFWHLSPQTSFVKKRPTFHPAFRLTPFLLYSNSPRKVSRLYKQALHPVFPLFHSTTRSNKCFIGGTFPRYKSPTQLPFRGSQEVVPTPGLFRLNNALLLQGKGMV